MTGTPLAGAEFWRREGLIPLLALLNGGGQEARVVGGAVRNALLGRKVEDVDVATTAPPGAVVARVEAAGLKAIPTGFEHGTVTVISGGHPYEVTTLREDVETDGRRAVVRFGRSWGHDAMRRDFTMNALYATPDGQVIDLVGGLADIARRRVRFIGDAGARIREDHLRILRLFRFHAAYGEGPMDGQALTAAERLKAGLSALSRERVRAEILKLVMAPGAAETLVIMSDAGLLQPILAGIGDLSGFARLVMLEAAMGIAPHAVRRLGALAVRVAEDAERLRVHLRLSNQEAQRLLALSTPLPDVTQEQARRALIYRLGGETVRDRALIAMARLPRSANSPAPERERLLPGFAHVRCTRRLQALARLVADVGEWVPPRFPITSASLVSEGLKPGPALGRALARAEAAWIAADFPEDPGRLAEIVRTAARSQGG